MKLIKLNQYHYVIVDDSEKKEDFCIPIGAKYIDDTMAVRESVVEDIDYWSARKDYYLITHSTEPLNDIGYKKIKSLSLSEVEELIGGVDVNAENSINNFNEKHWQEYWENVLKKESCATNGKRDVYIAGYNKCFEENKEKKYTIQDIYSAFEAGQFNDRYKLGDIEKKSVQKTEWNIEFDQTGKLKLK